MIRQWRQRRHLIALVHHSFLRRRRTLSTASTTTSTKKRRSGDDAHDYDYDDGGYKSFGSFHSDNVEELIRLPAERYVAPLLPFRDDDIDDASSSSSPSSPHGAPFANSNRHASSYPDLDRNTWTFLNHGAFGLGLGVGLRRAERWRKFAESQPLRYFDRHLLEHMTHSARDMVDFVTTNEMDATRLREGTAMVQNVTSGMNAVVGGHRRASLMGGGGGGGRSVFYYDIAYGSNKKICKHYHGDDAIEIPFEEDWLPLLWNISTRKNHGDWDDDVAEIYLSALDATIRKYVRGGGGNNGGRPVAGSLLILDHITSNTAIRLPISSIAKYAKEEHGMVVVVDGAHALWSLPLDVGALLSPSDDRRESGCGGGHVDAYLTNCHKWFSSPRGAAFVFCADPKVRDTILSRPAVISHGIDDGFLSRFMWDGCRDYSAQLSLPAVLDHWNNAINLDCARMEVRTNLREGIRILCSHWHPGVDSSCLDDNDGGNSAEAGLTLVPLGMHAPTMALVRLPDRTSGDGGRLFGGDARPSSSDGGGGRKTSADAKRVQDYLYGRRVEVPVKCVRGVLYVRVSCHLYNTADEFDRLGRVAFEYPSP